MFELYSKSDALPAPSMNLEQALRIPVGVASPLWLLIGGAASAGMAYWWATQWLRPVNLEAFMPKQAEALPSAPVDGEAAALANAAVVAEDLQQAVAEIVTETAEPVVDAAAQIAPEPASFVSEPEPVVEIPAEVALAAPANDGLDSAPEPPPLGGRKGKSAPAMPEA